MNEENKKCPQCGGELKYDGPMPYCSRQVCWLSDPLSDGWDEYGGKYIRE